MSKKRFLVIYNEYQTSNGKTIKAEPYFIDTKEEYVDEVYFTIKGYPTMSDEQVVDLLNEQDEALMMQREKALYWRNKAEDIFGDMQTNVELKKENKKLKERIKKLKLELNTHKHPLWSTRQCQERIRELEDAIKTYDTGCKEIYGDKCKLEEENQRLKTMNKELIEIIQGISKDTARTITELWNGDDGND